MADGETSALWPATVLVVGGGRWARVIGQVLCDVAPPSVDIVICSARGSDVLRDWAARTGLRQRVRVLSQRPDRIARDCAAIVTNAARDHVSAARWALDQSRAVLVEKPLAPTEADARALADFAARQGALLAPALVLRFASYLAGFRDTISAAGVIRSLSIQWTDPATEERYGEPKRYDAGVPIVADCLPHIFAVFDVLFGSLPSFQGEIAVEAGGRRVTVPLSWCDIPCRIQLERGAERRQRTMTIETDRQRLALDFTVEPGMIVDVRTGRVTTGQWEDADRPLACMLKSFLRAAGGGPADARLDLESAIRALAVVEAVSSSYRAATAGWLTQVISAGDPLDDSQRYALGELLQAAGPVAAKDQLETRIRRLRSHIANPPSSAPLATIEDLVARERDEWDAHSRKTGSHPLWSRPG